MVGAIDFYRDVDLVKEAVIPQQDGMVFSSDAKEAHEDSKIVALLGDNKLIHGISVRYPDYLAQFFQKLRLNLAGSIEKTSQCLESKSNQYYKHEKNITSTVASLHSDPREELLPGFAYIAVGAMSGSVLARSRNILARFTAPLILGTACFYYALPTTFKNTTRLLHELESTAFPTAVAKQDLFYQETRRAACRTAAYCSSSINSIKEFSKWTRHSVKEWTGLSVE
ncbi:hypothetical protein ZYGR_0AG06350 [Zygosaccharomyces rouxii]|uniref:MICOS complex subunit n=1 Tax=Zygosaccharomyces rouxii TaxID=4956 RepID=A0A1Q3AA85_ZYGRO|nr:hypothetical protein ZYGR_0AG06350 [Zygosaccharomyces rouxii]